MNPSSAKLRARIEAAKQRSQDKKAGKLIAKPIPERMIKAVDMGYAYEAALANYRHLPTLQYFKPGDGFRSRTITFLFKAATMADEAGAAYSLWVEAQFYWFHKWFRRAPKIQELSGQSGKFPAARRYQDYLKLQRRGKITSDVLPKEWASRETVDAINQERLQQLCSVWGFSEEEIIRQFAGSDIFDAAWLKRNAIFQDLRNRRLV